MKVALDLDNVIVDIISAARDVMASSARISPSEITYTHIYDAPFSHPDPEIAKRLLPDHAFWRREDVLAGSKPLPGSLDAVTQLHEAGHLGCYITRRPPAVASITKRWLAEAGFPQKPVPHVGHTEKVLNHALCKSTACRTHSITHMVDDQAHEARTLQAAGIRVILVDAPIGYVERQEFLKEHPDMPVAPNISAAISILLQEFQAAA